MRLRIAFPLLFLLAAAIFLPGVHVRAGSDARVELQQQGRETWYVWTGGDTDAQGNVVGDQALWRILAMRTHGAVDLLQAVDSRYRNQRFHRFGVMNDPDCTAAAAPDQYGFYLDTCTPSAPNPPDTGEPAGIVGLRRFRNPKFDAAKWDLKKYLADPGQMEPPYLIGVACAFCHVGFHPLHPPADPEHPTWHNLHPGIGNQYFREQVFNTAKYPTTREMQPSDFRWQAAHAEPPGTSDTSQVATDHIANASTINNIVSINHRPMHLEVTADGVTRHVFHVLKDGADSVGSACLDDPTERPGINDTACAAMRGYLNIGVCAAAWTALVDPVYGISRVQAPFHVKQARQANKACDESWTATVARLGGLEAFLRTFEPLHLSGADGGAQYLSKDPAALTRGKLVFADNCAQCHSSKRPPAGTPQSQRNWFREAVLRDDFLDGNYLSDDERYPVSLIGTNAQRALATNAERGHLWEEFSSETYKQSAAVRVTGMAKPLPFLPAPRATGGTGYYRTPTLANVWATAPFLHNNSVGIYTGDPSVAGRMAAYESAMKQLLWPELRPGRKAVARTTQASRFELEGGDTLCVGSHTPVELITNIQAGPRKPMHHSRAVQATLCALTGSGMANRILLSLDNAPDFVPDRGHTFGATLPDADKRALIEYMKTF